MPDLTLKLVQCLLPPGGTESLRMRRRPISKRVLASLVDIVMGGGMGPFSRDSTYLLYGRIRAVVDDSNLGLRPQYWSYCSDCHSEDQDGKAWQGSSFLVPCPMIFKSQLY
ncbi:hypothetical protein AVEN_234151-1 [Araneus ventricosus]|uniref:Uncharacterized protein n=1 Tax=Araneus ventricosus TaxID=182803 RepID=A0A4Y2V905_ARAVE|nr:hypothetical protein AVEN_234151-1 [Araneus ventricosus]